MAGLRKDTTGLRRLVNAARYSIDGLSAGWSEAAFRQELALAAFLVPLGLYLGSNGTARALLAGSVLLVLIIELANSAIEAAVDRVSLDEHPLARRAKDLGSAAVMLSLLNVAGVWALVLAG
jgi:diacylglycerol kinase (ATP)